MTLSCSHREHASICKITKNFAGLPRNRDKCIKKVTAKLNQLPVSSEVQISTNWNNKNLIRNLIILSLWRNG